MTIKDNLDTAGVMQDGRHYRARGLYPSAGCDRGGALTSGGSDPAWQDQHARIDARSGWTSREPL